MASMGNSRRSWPTKESRFVRYGSRFVEGRGRAAPIEGCSGQGAEHNISLVAHAGNVSFNATAALLSVGIAKVCGKSCSSWGAAQITT